MVEVLEDFGRKCVAAGVGASKAKKKFEELKKTAQINFIEKAKKKAKEHPGITATGIAGATFAATKLRKKPSKFYHVISEDQKPFAQVNPKEKRSLKALTDKARHWMK